MRRAGKTMKQIAEALPNRTLFGCINRWESRLLDANPELKKYGGLQAPKLRKNWTEAEHTALLDLRAQGKSLARIQQEDFPNRTTKALERRIAFLTARGDEIQRKRRKGSPISAEDEDILRNMQTQYFTVRQIADVLKRPAKHLYEQLKYMGFVWRQGRIGMSKPWTEAELEVLKRFVRQNNPTQRMNFGYEDIKDLVPGRSYDAIIAKLLQVRKQLEVVTPRPGRAWTPVEIEELQRFMAARSPHTPEATAEKFARTLNRSWMSVQNQVRVLQRRAGKPIDVEGNKKAES